MLATGWVVLASAAHAEEVPSIPAAPAPVLAANSANGSFKLSGGIYLFDYLPELSGTKDKFEIYAFILNVDAATADDHYGLHVQTRARDSKLRSFYVSDVWFQEAYAWAKTPVGELHAGKFYRKVGILWDDSFFGNVQYFNGLKLNPDYGAELVGSRPLSSSFAVDYSLQFLANNDQVDGSLPGRDVESDPNATLADTGTVRLVPTWTFGPNRSFALGVSGLSGRIDRSIPAAPANPAVGKSFRLGQVAGDATLTWGPSISYVEVLRQTGEKNDAFHPFSRPGYDDATYYLAGTRWQVHPRLNLRVNWSRVNYQGSGARETEIVPGLVFLFASNFKLIAEYDWWKNQPKTGPEEFLDKSYNLVLNYNF
ncbi:MAG TPA: hypothetical protein VMM92_07745 [Thermoanaerobaculia bacterium]|nr:hypothetical protein [Thermoanaerobaculia bacterium]